MSEDDNGKVAKALIEQLTKLLQGRCDEEAARLLRLEERVMRLELGQTRTTVILAVAMFLIQAAASAVVVVLVKKAMAGGGQ